MTVEVVRPSVGGGVQARATSPLDNNPFEFDTQFAISNNMGGGELTQRSRGATKNCNSDDDCNCDEWYKRSDSSSRLGGPIGRNGNCDDCTPNSPPPHELVERAGSLGTRPDVVGVSVNGVAVEVPVVKTADLGKAA